MEEDHESTETPPPKDTPKRQFFRDYDDSSDEEELAEKTKPIDYESTFRASHKAKYHKDTDSRLFWIIHALSNRLLYSREVNTEYFQEKKPMLIPSPPTIHEIFTQMISNILSILADEITPFLTTDEIRVAVSEDESAKFLKRLLAFTEPEKLARTVESAIRKSSLTQKKYSTHVAKIIRKQLLEISFEDFFQEYHYDYTPAEDEEMLFSPELYNKLNKSFGNDIVELAVESIKERVQKNGKAYPRNDSRKKQKLKTPFRKLSDLAWEIVSKLDARNSVAFYLDVRKDDLIYEYLFDLISLDQSENHPHQHDGWQKVIESHNNFWFAHFLTMSSDRLLELISCKLCVITSEKVEAYFDANRPTLGTGHVFNSTNTVDFLSNIRLANTTIKRELRNLKGDPLATHIYCKKTPKTLLFQWSFFKPIYAPTPETQSANATSQKRKNLVTNAGSYNDVLENIRGLQTLLKSSHHENSAPVIAKLIRALIKGDISSQLKSYEPHLQKIIVERITALGYLLFGCEVTRNPGSIIVHHMMLDLIIESATTKFTWKKALSEPHDMPMATKKSTSYSRCLNGYLSNMKGMIFSYKLDYSKDSQRDDLESFELLYSSECALITRWLAFKKIKPDSNLNVIAHAICQSFAEWFGEECFDLKQFITIQERPSKSTAKPSRKG